MQLSFFKVNIIYILFLMLASQSAFAQAAPVPLEGDVSPFLKDGVPDDKWVLYGEPHTNNRFIGCYWHAQACRSEHCMDNLTGPVPQEGVAGVAMNKRKQARPLDQTIKCMKEKCEGYYIGCIKNIGVLRPRPDVNN
jgi:hypothetical protein